MRAFRYLALVFIALSPEVAGAQNTVLVQVDTAGSRSEGLDATPAPAETRGRAGLTTLVSVGGAAEELRRDAQLRGRADAGGFLQRSPSSMTPRSGRARIAVLAPETALTWNSRIPYSGNDGAQWAGRGASGLVRWGVAAEAGPLRLIAAPEMVWSENRSFDGLLPVEWSDAQRSDFIPPWHVAQHSIDLPFRQGAGRTETLRPGQSSLALHAGPFAAGAATENQWWGPGVSNSLVMSNNAPGIPHLFLRTDGPVRTPIGRVHARWISGALRGSPHMTGGSRSLSAAVLTLDPSPVPGLTVGVSRAVYAPRTGAGRVLSGAGDVFLRWSGAADTLAAEPFEQILSLFGRWIVPEEGAEVYFEWSRSRLPESFRHLLQTPEHTQAFVLGARWLRPLGAGELRLAGEHANLEKSPTYRQEPTGSYYASAAVPHGYTHEGAVIGAAIGPGASGQWASIDWLRGRGRIGVHAGRVRWANDAYYDNPTAPRIIRFGQDQVRSRQRGHDVTVLAGMRAALPAGPLRLDVDWTVGQRYNFLFQNYSTNWNNRDLSVNVLNHTLRIGFTAIPRP